MCCRSWYGGRDAMIVSPNDRVLVTGAGGFLGSRVVAALLERGFRDIRCLVRSPYKVTGLETLGSEHPEAQLDVARGNLLSRADCEQAVRGTTVIYHLAAGTGHK